MSVETLPEALLKRKAVVYVRQSTQTQVQKNLESQRRQYDLVQVARRHGFASIEVIAGELLLAVQPIAVEAALHAEHRYMEQQSEQQRIVELELQQALSPTPAPAAVIFQFEKAFCFVDRRAAPCTLDRG